MPAWFTVWLQTLLTPLVKTAVDEANADLLADVKAAIAASEQSVLGAVSGVTGSVSADVQQIIGAESNAVQQITSAVVAGIKGILPFPI